VITSIGYNYRHAPAVEHARTLIAAGKLGRITNVRAAFFSGYANEPKGALSWRFNRELAGSGVLADLFSHASDLCQYVVGPIAELTALTSTVYTERPKLAMGSGTHFDVIEGGEMGPVENEDYAAALVRFSSDSQGAGAVGTIEASRVIVGPSCGYQIEVYGTEGSVKWDFERMNELQIRIGRGGDEPGYLTVNANPKHGDYSHFQPGPGNSMGFDDLKTIEAKKFLLAVAGGAAENSNVHDALSAAATVTAAEVSAATGLWQKLEPVAGTTASRIMHG
jgi:predicted dehydrogenase